MKRKLKIFYLLLYLILPWRVYSQTTVQVATRHLTQTFSGVNQINILAEKADIEITAWNKPTVELSLAISALHPDKSTAASDLENLKFGFNQKNGKLVLSTYLLVTDNEPKPSSNYRIRYVLKIPAEISLDLRNSFGKITISGGKKAAAINSEFCNVVLKNFSGKSQINTKYGDVNIFENSGETTISSFRTNISIARPSGAISLKSIYGNLKISEPVNVQSLKIEGEKAEISIEKLKPGVFGLTIKNSYAKIEAPQDFGNIIAQKNKQSLTFPAAHLPQINIINTFGTIKLDRL